MYLVDENGSDKWSFSFDFFPDVSLFLIKYLNKCLLKVVSEHISKTRVFIIFSLNIPLLNNVFNS